MPTLNGAGQRITELNLLPKEMARVRYLISLTYPDQYETLLRLKHEDFRTWLYGQEPLVQLIRSGDEHFKNLLKYQRTKTFVNKAFDALWRFLNGPTY